MTIDKTCFIYAFDIIVTKMEGFVCGLKKIERGTREVQDWIKLLKFIESRITRTPESGARACYVLKPILEFNYLS